MRHPQRLVINFQVSLMVFLSYINKKYWEYFIFIDSILLKSINKYKIWWNLQSICFEANILKLVSWFHEVNLTHEKIDQLLYQSGAKISEPLAFLTVFLWFSTIFFPANIFQTKLLKMFFLTRFYVYMLTSTKILEGIL